MQLDRFVVSWRVVQRVLMSFRCPSPSQRVHVAIFDPRYPGSSDATDIDGDLP
jgi:hypothetical protein